MSSAIIPLRDIFEKYKKWVSDNPQQTSECETAAKWVSYLLSGKINNSHIFSELIYCSSNLVVLFNDRIINNVKQLELPSSGEVLKMWLTVVEYCEVLFELSAKRFWGSTGKWLVIIAIQVFKSISRLILVYNHKESIIKSPPISPLQRSKIVQKINTNKSVVDVAHAQFESMCFTLKGSGRVVRRVDASPPISMRTWRPLQQDTGPCENQQSLEEALSGRFLVAETIYIAKPIAHLASVALFGERSWKPWLLALACDLTSLQLYKSPKNVKGLCPTPQQQMQLSRRTVVLILYLIRSPFYEKHSKDKINALLVSLSKNVPLARLLCNPLLQYLPYWQSNYFHMWST